LFHLPRGLFQASRSFTAQDPQSVLKLPARRQRTRNGGNGPRDYDPVRPRNGAKAGRRQGSELAPRASPAIAPGDDLQAPGVLRPFADASTAALSAGPSFIAAWAPVRGPG